MARTATHRVPKEEVAGEAVRLTAPQHRAIELRNQNYTFREIGDMMGISHKSARLHYVRGKKKIDGGHAVAPQSKAAKEAKKILGAELNLPPEVIEALSGHEEVPTEMKIRLYESAAMRAVIALLDPEKLAKANAAQLAIASGTMLDKARLLKGEATSIVSIEDRRKLPDLIAALAKEAKRRGFEIDGEVVREDAPERALVAHGGDEPE